MFVCFISLFHLRFPFPPPPLSSRFVSPPLRSSFRPPLTSLGQFIFPPSPSPPATPSPLSPPPPPTHLRDLHHCHHSAPRRAESHRALCRLFWTPHCAPLFPSPLQVDPSATYPCSRNRIAHTIISLLFFPPSLSLSLIIFSFLPFCVCVFFCLCLHSMAFTSTPNFADFVQPHPPRSLSLSALRARRLVSCASESFRLLFFCCCCVRISAVLFVFLLLLTFFTRYPNTQAIMYVLSLSFVCDHLLSLLVLFASFVACSFVLFSSIVRVSLSDCC